MGNVEDKGPTRSVKATGIMGGAGRPRQKRCENTRRERRTQIGNDARLDAVLFPALQVASAVLPSAPPP